MTHAPTVLLPGDDADPHPTLAQLRTEAAIHRVATPDGPPAWLITRYTDVEAALVDPRLALDHTHSHGRDYTGFVLPPALSAHLLATDGAQHTRLRRHIAPTFTAHRVRTSWAAGLQSMATELVDNLPTGRTVDLVAELAVPLPVRLITNLLPLPTTAREEFHQWAHRLLRQPPQQQPRARDTLAEMQRIITAAVTAPVETAPPSLRADLLHAHAAREIASDELTSLVFYLTFVWLEIASDALGSILRHTLEQPTHKRLPPAPDGWDALVEETLRFDPPQLVTAPRYARETLTIDGVRIAAGDTLLLSVASANRDEHVFTDAKTFHASRWPNPHLSLGHGAHACPAAALTRLLMRTTAETLLDRYPASTLTSDPTWRGNFRHRGPATLPAVLS